MSVRRGFPRGDRAQRLDVVDKFNIGGDVIPSGVHAVPGVPQFESPPTPTRRRKAFSNAGGAGVAVAELAPRDAKACAELDALFSTVFNIQVIA